jgi:type IV secretion system protein VirB9
VADDTQKPLVQEPAAAQKPVEPIAKSQEPPAQQYVSSDGSAYAAGVPPPVPPEVKAPASPAPEPVAPAPETAKEPETPKEQVQAAVKRPPAPFKQHQAASNDSSDIGGLGNILGPDTVPLTAREKQALDLSDDWAKSGPMPFLSGGKLTYTYGAGGIPTIIAAPMQIVDVQLEPGEHVNEIITGDSARWLVDMGDAGNTTHIFIKPLDVGLESSLAITTNRRVYHLRLLSKPKEYTPYVGFVYTNDIKNQLAVYKADEAKKKKWQSTETAGGGSANLAALNFDYEVKGDAPWKPERVYDDGKKTYVQLPPQVSTGEMPVLLVRKGGKDVLVNYRVKGRVIEVDGLFETIALVVGVNGGLFNSGFGGEKQQLVEITRRSGGGIRKQSSETETESMGG